MFAGRGGDNKYVVIRGVKFFAEKALVTTAGKTVYNELFSKKNPKFSPRRKGPFICAQERYLIRKSEQDMGGKANLDQ